VSDAADTPAERPMPSVALSFARALLLRCPRCGARGIFRHWFALAPACPACGLVLDRGEGDYWVGAYAFNLIFAELLGLGAAVAWIAWTWPEVPWDRVQFGVVTLMVLLPIVTFPWSRTLWLAWDLAFRPPSPER
jgi:uncharacterized protein (DUF983 family)